MYHLVNGLLKSLRVQTLCSQRIDKESQESREAQRL